MCAVACAIKGQVGFEMILTAGGLTIGLARDVSLDGSATEVDTTVRDDGGFKTFRQGLKEFGLTVNQLWVPSNAGLKVLESAWINGTVLAVTLRDQDGFGYDGCAIVMAFTKGEPLDDAATLDVTLKGTGVLTPVLGTS